jgi:hypothetical protein
MSDIFNITQCNIAQLIAEASRFLFHVMLVHITTSIIENKTDIFNETLFKTLLITAMAITLYHIFIRKIVEPKLEKMKTICIRNDDTRKDKIIKIHKTDPLRPKYRTGLDSSIILHNEQENKQNTNKSIRSVEEIRSVKERFEEPEIYGEYVSKYRY